MLIEVDDAEIVGALDRAAVGGERAGEQLQQRALAAAVGAEEAEAHARAEHEIELPDDGAARRDPCRRPRRPRAAASAVPRR